MAEDEDGTLDVHEGPICPICSGLLEEEVDYCPLCDAPLSRSATLDPVKAVLSFGEMMRVGMDSPSMLFVSGLWLVFMPGIIQAVYGLSASRMIIGPLIMLCIYGFIPFKATQRYLALRRPRSVEGPNGPE
jgi:hypothetical protein